MKDITISKLVQDISAVLGSLLPLAQLFFNQWSFAFDKVFIAHEQFMGVSVVTLIISYIFIIAYLTKPFSDILLPRQRSKQEALQEYWTKQNTVQVQINNLTALPKVDQKELAKLYKIQRDMKMPAQPKKVKPDNHVAVSVAVITVSAFTFIGLSFVGEHSNVIIGGIQALTYMVLVSFSALMLTIYKKVNDNNNYWNTNRATRAERAIKLAIDANGFTKLPQVTFFHQYETNSFPQEFHVFAEYKNKVYEIITDSEARYLVSVTPTSIKPVL